MKISNKQKNYIPDYEHLFKETANGTGVGNSVKVYKRMTQQNLGKLFISIILFLIKHSPFLLIPLFSAEVINTVTNGGEGTIRRLIVCAIVLFLLLVQNIPTHVLYEKYTNQFLRTISAGLRNTLVHKLQALSLTYHKEIERGRLQSKFLRDIEAIEFLNTHLLKTFIPGIINVLFSIFISASKSITVTIFFLLVIPVNVSLVYFFRHSMAHANKKFRQENENFSAKISNMIDMIPITKAHGLEGEEVASIDEKIRVLRDEGLSVDRLNSYFGAYSWVVSQLMNAGCLFFTAYLAYKGKIQIGDIVLYQSYFHNISNNILALVHIYPGLTKGMESVNSVSEVILSNDIEDNSGKISLSSLDGSVTFENVSYRYPKSTEDMIKSFSLSVAPGECVAFVGASGSGKSTIMNMIIGFLKPTSGLLCIDGTSVADINLQDYRRFISVVPQNSILFTGTIRENIIYGLPNVSDERLREVVRLANIEEFIGELPLGLDTPIGENGALLSGGQKQRICIARALIRDPKILILDEATSALDNISEYQVQKAINHLTKDRTTFIVAHRLSTIRNADKIVVMEGGQCIEMGTYNELMEKKGTFFELKTLNDNVSRHLTQE